MQREAMLGLFWLAIFGTCLGVLTASALIAAFIFNMHDMLTAIRTLIN